MIHCFRKEKLFFVVAVCCFLASCSVNRQITKQAKQLLVDSAVSTGHIGISIYDPATGKYLYNHNATQYFIPASNTKLFTLYAGMKYLGDSLVGARYKIEGNEVDVLGNADPTFLHNDYLQQPLYNFLKANSNKKITLQEIVPITTDQKQFTTYGYGWVWDDFNSDYMLERNFFPMYGNTAKISSRNNQWKIMPPYFATKNFKPDSAVLFSVERSRESNFYFITKDENGRRFAEVPIKFGIDKNIVSVEDSLLTDTLKQTIYFSKVALRNFDSYTKIHSQPADSLFKPMMHRSDNFFAEQTLLMASNEYLGHMNDAEMIDTILKSSLRDVPQKPKWVDGSGLSRYNLFTPNDFVYILNKMKNDFGLERMKVILATGGEGTLSSYYKNMAGNIYAKTGTLSNNCALSGYLITAKGRLLIFSVINNNYITGATPVRRATERFLNYIQKKF